ncbi:hypothetical protein [Sanguibacter suaedae]|uniref:Uncharacterized protein n=1 Tax=Sanguibacter suaedae TaxID=2795737 RepID=A0A934I7K8_9MICO|nr:hypothetical protein [Sanguibacter suaedae]MBI9115696.1 hypothetical protein [Sanguibacter suaedae]
MRNDDVMARLRAADPLRGVDLGTTGVPGSDLREQILGTARPGGGQAARRRGPRRAVVSGVVALALVGGGAAYATYAANQARFTGGDGDAPTCLTEWAAEPRGEPVPETDGVARTGDVVADCQWYQAQSGLPPIEDPVAFRAGAGGRIYVAPADQVPDGATVFPPAAAEDDAAMHELELTTYDVVDGTRSRCMPEEEAVAAARADLERLGLTGWDVVTRAPVPADVPGPCARGYLDHELSLVTITVGIEDPDVLWEEPKAVVLRDALREGISEQCVGLAEAEQVVARALEVIDEDWAGPPVVIADPDAGCARVDMLVGGGIEITVHGPAVASP